VGRGQQTKIDFTGFAYKARKDCDIACPSAAACPCAMPTAVWAHLWGTATSRAATPLGSVGSMDPLAYNMAAHTACRAWTAGGARPPTCMVRFPYCRQPAVRMPLHLLCQAWPSSPPCTLAPCCAPTLLACRHASALQPATHAEAAHSTCCPCALRLQAPPSASGRACARLSTSRTTSRCQPRTPPVSQSSLDGACQASLVIQLSPAQKRSRNLEGPTSREKETHALLVVHDEGL